MASLQNEQIDQSYQGLIKTANNLGGAPFPPVKLQYGDGQELPISIGDGTSVGIGDIVSITSGTRGIELNSNNLGLNGLSNVDGLAGTVQYLNGTFTYGASFPGAPATNVDFSNATVTGLPTGSAGLVTNGANGMMSDSSLTTNPALSTGTNSIVLGDNAKDEGNDDAIAIGLNARVREPGAICIGKNTEAYEESIAIGNSAAAIYPGVSIGQNAKNFGNGNSVVIGTDTNTNYADDVVNIGGNTTLGSDNNDNIVIGSSVTVSSGNAERNIHIGNDIAASTAGVDDNVIIGHGATTNTGTGVTIVGTGASATANGAVALGKDVVAATADTVSVKALETQTDGGVNIKGDGTNAGKLKLYCEDASGAHNVTLEGPAHAGGQTYTLKFPNVQSAGSQILEADSSGNLSWINTPSGGGAAPAYGAYGGNGMRGVLARANNSTQSYRTWITTTGYGVTGQIKDDTAQYAIIGLQAGDTIQEVQVGIQTAVAGATMEVAFYDVDVDSDNTLYIKDRLLSLGSVDASSAGSKTITLGTPFTMPSGKVNSQVAVLCFPSTTGVGVTNWSQATWNGAGGDPAGTTVYRAMGLNVNPGVAMGTALPASIGAIGTTGVVYGSETNGALWLLYR